ncbi:MAG: Cu(I)-responsive transcriptional regulator [Neisseria sp.]|nr:Cu(I)-responsive transcriptional regulator [Neisseria sp.]
MNISKAAQLSGLSAKMIRDYEKAGLIPPAARSPSGYRQYTEREISDLHFIKHARDVGFSLSQIRELLHLKNNPRRTSREVRQITGEHLSALLQKIKNLQHMADTLQNLYQCCQGGNSPDCPIITLLSSESEQGGAAEPRILPPPVS